MKSLRVKLLACSGLAAMVATSAQASVDEYSIGGEETVRINLEVCSTESQLAVQGQTGADIDFVVTSPTGRTIHTDQGVDDFLSYVIEKSGNDCETFGLTVSNLGEEENGFTVVLEPITEASTRVTKYIIQANESRTVEFKACGTSAELTVRGDGDTDLDFVVRNSDGGVVHENDDLTDRTTATLAGLLSDCETFELDIVNLGDVYNATMVVVAPEGVDEETFAGTPPSTSLASSSSRSVSSGSSRAVTEAESSGAGEYRAEANSVLRVDLPVCGEARLEVRGDGDTDLDFTINNSSGDTVHSDFDLSDVTFATLESAGECETFQMDVSNLGDVYNVFTVALIDPDEQGGPSGTGEYRINANSETKVALRICETTFITARGDGDTDLDFDVVDPSGASVHSDYDLTDRTEFTLDPGSGCVNYQMTVKNLGNVYNLLTVAFDGEPVKVAEGSRPTVPPPPPITIAPPPPIMTAPPAEAETVGEGEGQYRANARTMVRVDLPVCEETQVWVQGDGDTDLDFLVTNVAGNTVHTNYDFTDRTSFTVIPDGCETFIMTVDNLGGVFNVFDVSYGEEPANFGATAVAPPAAPPVQTFVDVGEDTASTDGLNRNLIVLNQSGETISTIYWSNSAVLTWGEDQLGDANVLSENQEWPINVFDGSRACLFDFKAVTASGREIVLASQNACEVSAIIFE